ncbi:MAG: adenylate/guanylate cyclase domain-containing protein [Hyphomicrobium sp.]
MERRLAAILAADVVGYSRLMGAEEEDTLVRLKAHRDEVADPAIAKHKGRIVKLMGDGMLAEFASVVDAVRCAVDIQEAMSERRTDVPENRRIQLRIGINLGDIIVDGDDIYGDGVNVAARLEGLAEPGGVCISGDAYRQVKGKITAKFEDMGERELKNLAEPVRAYRIVLNSTPASDAATAPETLSLPIGVAELDLRDFEIARAHIGGAGDTEIAQRLKIHPDTVRTQLRSVYEKLSVSSKSEMFRALESDGAFDPDAVGGSDSIKFPARPSIAVLPFVNMSGDPEQEFFTDGLTEDIITRLSYLRGLLVIARTSSFAFKGRAVRVQDAASDLGAGYVLEGSVRRSGDRVRITAQLIDGTTGAHVWAQKYDRNLTDVFEIQDEITHAIVVAMQVELTDGEVVQIDPGWTINVDAWEKFHQGILAFLTYTEESNLRARRFFEEALSFDPEYLDSRVYLAWTFWQDSRSGFSVDRSSPLSTCRKLVDELKAMGAGTANAKHLESTTLLIERRHDEALAVSAEAVPLGPCKIFGYTPAALVNIYSGNLQSALDLLRTTIRLSPYTPSDAVYTIAYALSLLGDHRNAVQTAEDYMRRVPSDLFAYTLLAMTYAFAGNTGKSRAIIKTFRELYPSFTLKEFVAHEPYRDRQELDRVANALREAGLPD